MNILKIFTEKRITGNIGEDAACAYMRRKHYKILERNYVAAGHEVDIIAKNRNFICFVEVKARTSSRMTAKESRPAAAVNSEKMRSIISTARYYISTHATKKRIRFDVIEVYLADDKSIERIEYMEGAFTQNDTQWRY